MKPFDIFKAIQRDLLKLEGVKAVGLLGSLATQEYVKGWSDIDILLLLDSDRFGNIKRDLLLKLEAVLIDKRKKFDLDISFLIHTEDDLENYVSFSYLKNYAKAKHVLPFEDSIEALVNVILEKRAVKDNVIKRYTVHHIRHQRFNFLRKYISIPQENTRKKMYLLIDSFLELARFSTEIFEVQFNTKREMVEGLEKYIDNPEVYELLLKAYDLRKDWEVISDKDLDYWRTRIESAYIQMCTNIISKYDEPTPEEFINY